MENLDKFIDYWDDVIRRWFDNDIESRQQLFFSCKPKQLELTSMHMPEPYWGDPYNCSIVIANYNPAGGTDRNRHAYRECADWKHTFINEVKKRGYSEVVKDFPIIKDIAPQGGVCWWEDYGGRNWWLKRCDWLQKWIINALESTERITGNPFAIEFCAWHSEKWLAQCNSFYKKNETLRETINTYFIDTLVDAISHSKAKLGVCVGSQFEKLLESAGAQRVVPKGAPDDESQKTGYQLRLFKLKGVRILSVWGAGYNRFPNIDSEKLKNYLKNE